MTETTGAQVAVKALADAGIRLVFGLPGAFGLRLFHEADLEQRLDLVIARHEQNAMFMADGAARRTGALAACLCTYGPGAMNALAALTAAAADHVPVVVLLSAPGPDQRKRPGHVHQTVDQLRLFQHSAKRVCAVRQAADVAIAIRDAAIVATTPPQGPVILELDDAVLGARVGERQVWRSTGLGDRAPDQHPARLDAEALTRAVECLTRAERPVALVGGGARSEADRVAVERLVTHLDAPVVSTVNGKGVVPETHPLSAGHCLQTPEGQELCANADVVVAFGTDLGVLDTRNGQLTLGHQLIHIDVDERAFGQLYRPVIAVRATVADAARALLDGIPRRTPTRANQVAALRDTTRRRLAAASPTAVELCDALDRAVGPDGTIVGDVTIATYWLWSLRQASSPSSLLCSFNFAALGYAVPAAVGAVLADPNRPVVCVAGDGGVMFSVQELSTIAERQLPICVVVIDDGQFGSTAKKQASLFGRSSGTVLHNPDFAALARSFGLRAVDVANPAELGDVLAAAVAGGEPLVIDLHVSLPMPWPSTPKTVMAVDR